MAVADGVRARCRHRCSNETSSVPSSDSAHAERRRSGEAGSARARPASRRAARWARRPRPGRGSARPPGTRRRRIAERLAQEPGEADVDGGRRQRRGSRPQERNSSIEPVLTRLARGIVESSRLAVDDERLDAVAREGDRGGQAGGAGAGDEDRDSGCGAFLGIFIRQTVLYQTDASDELLGLRRMSPRAYEQRLRADSAAATRDPHPRRPLRPDPSRAIEAGQRRRDRAARRRRPLDHLHRLRLPRRPVRCGGDGAHRARRFPAAAGGVDQPDARQSLRGAITAGVEIFAVDPDVFRALHAMEKLDADAVGGAIATDRGTPVPRA